MFIAPIVSISGIFLIYFIWLNEGINIIASTYSNKLKRPSVKSPRNILVLLLAVVIISFVLIYIIVPFANIEREIENGTAVLSDFAITIYNGSSFSDANNEMLIYPDSYILLSLLALLGILFDLASPIVVGLLVFITSPMASIRRDLMITKARRKYFRLKDNLEIIGITGSQGKSTTKELLFELINDSFNTVKTPENYNTDYGVAATVFNRVKNNTKVFIAEMGAYRTGEIKKICFNFPPDISIITDMDVQHVGLFGSREKLFKAKSEIAKYMKPNGELIINGDNEYCLRLIDVHDDNIKIVVHKENLKKLDKFNIEKNPKVEVYIIDNIKETKSRISFELTDKDITSKFEVPQKGKHLVSNISYSIVAASLMGVSYKDIQDRLKKLNTKLPRLAIDTGDDNTIIINDSYNSSRKGFIAAVNTLDMISKNEYEDLKANENAKRIVITKGIYGLGKHKSDIYKKDLIHEFKDKVDILITTDGLLEKVLKEEHLDINVIRVRNFAEMIYETRKAMNPGDIILVEGKVDQRVMKELISDYA
ncbi:MAG: Mur ligase family protein [Candidatus Dojkabacteria bacterium]|nr:Mur ligase family protein [Candidatus Dojkabacteria bacterium]